MAVGQSYNEDSDKTVICERFVAFYMPINDVNCSVVVLLSQ